MTDKELLELAAKAAGWTWWQSKHGYWNVTSPDGNTESCCVGWALFDRNTGEKLSDPTPYDALMECDWNPLTDDGDALRLAVKLELVLEVWNDMVYAYDGSTFNIEEPITPTVDPYAATRRAIVRAAAEIGKGL